MWNIIDVVSNNIFVGIRNVINQYVDRFVCLFVL